MKIKNGYKFELNGWTYISIEGTPYNRGFAHGYLLADEIKDAFNTYKFSLYDSTGLDLNFFLGVSNYFFKKPTQENHPEFFEELKGITDGANKRNAKITLDKLILFNNMASIEYAISHLSEYINDIPELNTSTYNSIKLIPKEGGSKDRCSAFMAIGNYTQDGKICCAHNSFDDFLSGQTIRFIIDVKPTNGNRFLYQGGPGCISSQTDFFVTGSGFIGTETTIGGFTKYKYGDPITCRIRKCMQYANTLDDYVSFLTINNAGDYANSWLIGDTKNNEIMRIELGLEYTNIEKKNNGYFIGFNATYDPRIRNLECSNSGFDDIRRHQGARKVRLEQLMEEHKGKINLALAQEIISDHYDVYLNKINPSSRSVCSHYELDDRAFMSQSDRPLPYQPRGAVDGTACDTLCAKNMSFMAKWGSSCDIGFNREEFINKHMQWKRFSPYLLDRPTRPWTLFKSGMKYNNNNNNNNNKTNRRKFNKINKINKTNKINKKE